MTIRLYGLKTCDTCRAARRWLDENQASYDYLDVRQDGLDADTLAAFAQQHHRHCVEGGLHPVLPAARSKQQLGGRPLLRGPVAVGVHRRGALSAHLPGGAEEEGQLDEVVEDKGVPLRM